VHWFHLKHALDATEPSKSWHHNWGGPCDGSLSFPDLGVAPCEQLIANRLSLYQDGGCLTPLTLSAFVAIATVHVYYYAWRLLADNGSTPVILCAYDSFKCAWYIGTFSAALFCTVSKVDRAASTRVVSLSLAVVSADGPDCRCTRSRAAVSGCGKYLPLNSNGNVAFAPDVGSGDAARIELARPADPDDPFLRDWSKAAPGRMMRFR
jgi:hypothetical protein